MISKPDKSKLRLKRHKCIRGKIFGTAECPCLNIFRFNKNIYAQIIDDVAGVTLASASTLDKSISTGGTKPEQAQVAGKAIAEVTEKNSITTAVFDRSDYSYHGRIQALADAACENGLEFWERRLN